MPKVAFALGFVPNQAMPAAVADDEDEEAQVLPLAVDPTLTVRLTLPLLPLPGLVKLRLGLARPAFKAPESTVCVSHADKFD